MNKKWLPLLIILLLAATVFIIRNRQGQADKTSNTTVNRDRGFDRRVTLLKYSNHARCRMDCRQITTAEVEQIMQEGKINYKKSDLKNGRCPRYALEGFTSDRQRVRIVFAQCNTNTTVVTVIDLEKEWTCHCPGDDHAWMISPTKIYKG
ncbi:MAG TPA: DUF4258 domain-containing protein [Chitinophagaceae bacterium]